MLLFSVCAFVVTIIVLGFLLILKRKSDNKLLEMVESGQDGDLLKIHHDYLKQRLELFTEYGTPDYTVVLKEHSIMDEVTVFSNSQLVLILGNPVSFMELLSCSFTDNQRILKGGAVFVKAERDSVDGLNGGESGETGANSRFEIITHNYNVVVNLADASNSVIKIPVGSNFAKVKEILNLLNGIIKKNRKTA